MRSLPSLYALATTAFFAGCSEPLPPAFEPIALPVPSAVESTGPRLSTGPDGELILSWMEPNGELAGLHYARYRDGTWGERHTVIEALPLFVNWADLPSVVPLGGQHLAAHWLLESGDEWYAYDTVFTQSFDGGKSWLEPILSHTDDTDTEHGFVSMYAQPDGVGLIWLDGREMLNEVTEEDPTANGMTLRAATVDAEQRLHDEQIVDELICDCCQTDTALAASGPVAVYRDRTDSEIRDIYITRHLRDRWQPGNPVANDNWEIAGCPVNGPAIVADRTTVAIAWFSAGDEPVVQLKRSRDSGEQFGDAVEVVRGDNDGRVDVVLLESGDAAVSWLQVGNDGASIYVRRVTSDGGLGAIHTVTESAATFSVPQMVLAGEDLVFAWTEIEDDVSRIVSARVGSRAL